MEQSTSEFVTNLIKDALWKEFGNAIDTAGEILIPILIGVIISAIVGGVMKKILNMVFRTAGYSKRKSEKYSNLLMDIRDLISR